MLASCRPCRKAWTFPGGSGTSQKVVFTAVPLLCSHLRRTGASSHPPSFNSLPLSLKVTSGTATSDCSAEHLKSLCWLVTCLFLILGKRRIFRFRHTLGHLLGLPQSSTLDTWICRRLSPCSDCDSGFSSYELCTWYRLRGLCLALDPVFSSVFSESFIDLYFSFKPMIHFFMKDTERMMRQAIEWGNISDKE